MECRTMLVNFLLILAGLLLAMVAINGSLRPVADTNPFWV